MARTSSTTGSDRTNRHGLEGKRALVTGAGRGLGCQIAKALARCGARVSVNGRTAASIARTLKEIAGSGGTAEALVFDVADEVAADHAFAGIDTLDILVNNVGIRDRRPLDAFTLDDVRRLLEVNLIAPFDLCRRAARVMPEGGRIVNITSIAGPISNTGDAVYTMAKGGLDAMTRALAAELGPRGINVNAVAPGFFATETNADDVADPAVGEWLEKRTSLGRWGDPTEIAGPVVFLCSPEASYVTGHTLAVDGGYLAHY